ncbi:hypothetical protein [Zavarzinella formosa]|uniref:hypothetical protein n=1 Tax=Zavarzinella formosa TaxID=360055 RepID=UPI00037F26C3|nr:hypothetical protein [Zavarzinella formosa]
MNQPIAVFITEESVYGRIYRPANRIAVQLAGIAGSSTLSEDHLHYIRALGFGISEPNGQPIPHPRAKVDVAP